MSVVVQGFATVEVTGPEPAFEAAMHALQLFVDGADGLMIGTIPLPEKSPARVDLRYRGSMAGLDDVIGKLGRYRAKLARSGARVDTVAIGTWPTPESPKGGQRWHILASLRPD